jgi:hemerythrin-like metal-binding protein
MKNVFKAYPTWLYNSLAYVYLGAGVLTLLLLPNVMGVISGVLLVMAGGTVWTLRYKYRKEFAHYEKHLGESSFQDSRYLPAGGLVQRSWSKSYECGNQVIDGQHRRLFGLANEAIMALLEKQGKSEQEVLFNKMAKHMADHFQTEEAILAEAGDIGLVQHQSQHKVLLDKATGLFAQYQQGALDHRALLAFLADEVIEGHILKEDIPGFKVAA